MSNRVYNQTYKPLMVKCDDCRGVGFFKMRQGALNREESITCDACNGHGKINIHGRRVVNCKEALLARKESGCLA